FALTRAATSSAGTRFRTSTTEDGCRASVGKQLNIVSKPKESSSTNPITNTGGVIRVSMLNFLFAPFVTGLRPANRPAAVVESHPKPITHLKKRPHSSFAH